MTIVNSLKNYHKKTGSIVVKPLFLHENSKNGRTTDLYCSDSNHRFYIGSSKFKAQYPFISISDVSKPVNTLSQFH